MCDALAGACLTVPVKEGVFLKMQQIKLLQSKFRNVLHMNPHILVKGLVHSHTLRCLHHRLVALKKQSAWLQAGNCRSILSDTELSGQGSSGPTVSGESGKRPQKFTTAADKSVLVSLQLWSTVCGGEIRCGTPAI